MEHLCYGITMLYDSMSKFIYWYFSNWNTVDIVVVESRSTLRFSCTVKDFGFKKIGKFAKN